VDDVFGDEVRHAEEHARHDNEPDHDARRLHDLTAIRPLHPLKLSPASLEEAQETCSEPCPVRCHRRPRGRRWGGRPPDASSTPCHRLNRFVLTGQRLLLGGWLGHHLEPARRGELRLGQLGVRCCVVDWIGRAVAALVARHWSRAEVARRRLALLPIPSQRVLAPTTARERLSLSDATLFCAFAVTSHRSDQRVSR
jgi:hypothetical protein